MDLLVWFAVGGLLFAALIYAGNKMSARSKRDEEGLTPDELRRKRALERLAGDL